jgi:hypothetical protein
MNPNNHSAAQLPRTQRSRSHTGSRCSPRAQSAGGGSPSSAANKCTVKWLRTLRKHCSPTHYNRTHWYCNRTMRKHSSPTHYNRTQWYCNRTLRKHCSPTHTVVLQSQTQQGHNQEATGGAHLGPNALRGDDVQTIHGAQGPQARVDRLIHRGACAQHRQSPHTSLAGLGHGS